MKWCAKRAVPVRLHLKITCNETKYAERLTIPMNLIRKILLIHYKRIWNHLSANESRCPHFSIWLWTSPLMPEREHRFTLCTLLWSIHFFQIGWIILFEKFLNRNSENVDPQIFVEEISKLIALYSWDNFFDFSFRFEAQLMPFEIPKFLQQKSRVICLSNKNPFSFQNFNQLE